MENRLPTLTEREAEIMRLVAAGMSNKEIARALGVSQETIKGHLKAVFKKLKAPNRAGATAIWLMHHSSPPKEGLGNDS